jgi:hypothetical protein
MCVYHAWTMDIHEQALHVYLNFFMCIMRSRSTGRHWYGTSSSLETGVLFVSVACCMHSEGPNTHVLGGCLQ